MNRRSPRQTPFSRGQGSPVGPALPELGRELALALAGHARALADEVADLSGEDLFRAMDGYRGPLRTQEAQPTLVACDWSQEREQGLETGSRLEP